MGDLEPACREVVDLLDDHLDGLLSIHDRARVERHLAGCPHCHLHLEQMRATLAATRRIPDEPVDAAILDELLRAFRECDRSGGL